MSIIEYMAENNMHTYNEIFKPGLIIEIIPPAINESIMTILMNLKIPDLFVKRVITEENTIRTIATK